MHPKFSILLRYVVLHYFDWHVKLKKRQIIQVSFGQKKEEINILHYHSSGIAFRILVVTKHDYTLCCYGPFKIYIDYAMLGGGAD